MTWGEDTAAKLLGNVLPAGYIRCASIWEVPAAPCALVDLATVKQALGITDDTQDAEINRLITAHSQATENYLERQICKLAREVVFTARDYCVIDKLILPQFPVISIEKVEVDGNLIDAADWLLNGNSAEVFPFDGSGWRFRSYALFQYTAGYDPIPADIQDAMIQLIGMAIGASSASAHGAVKSQRVEGAVSESYYDPRGNSSDISSGAQGLGRFYSILDHYRSARAFI